MTTPEGAVVNAVLHYLKLRGVFCWRNNTGMLKAEHKGKERVVRYGFRGSADILGIDERGRFWAVEVKAAKGKLSAYQTEFLAEIRRRGGVALCVYPDTYTDEIDGAL